MALSRKLLMSAAFAMSRGQGSYEDVVREPWCPGDFHFDGVGDVSLVPTGWTAPNTTVASVEDGRIVKTLYGSRSYFATRCVPGSYSNWDYLALDLRGKTLTYTTDFSKAGCGCNAAFYLTSMHQNTQESDCRDYYCDANNVCGVSCAEIDIQEGNRFSWHSTLHGAMDHSGVAKGYGGGGEGWSGPRDWSLADFGPQGRCVDTEQPFQVAVSFPVDETGVLKAMEVTLTQEGHDCPLSISLDEYESMGEMDAALAAGMTPIVSYWSSPDMLWMDGKGEDNAGACEEDIDSCGQAVLFYDFSVTPAFPPSTRTTTMTTTSSTPPPVLYPLPPFLVFLSGVFVTLAAQGACVLGFWAMRTEGRRQAEDAPKAESPLKKKVSGASHQSLLMLAESGEQPTHPRSAPEGLGI